MTDAEKLRDVKAALEELWAMPYTAGEAGLGEEEYCLAITRIEKRLARLTGAQHTCLGCGHYISDCMCDSDGEDGMDEIEAEEAFR